MTTETEAAMAESLTVDTDAPIYFREEFDGGINDTDWETVSSYTDEEFVEDDPEYTIDQGNGVLSFEINSPWLSLQRSYLPYTYQDIRIDLEVEAMASSSSSISLFCRHTGNRGYEFAAASSGNYRIMRHDEGGSSELASGGIRSIDAGTGSRNIFTAICKGRP